MILRAIALVVLTVSMSGFAQTILPEAPEPSGDRYNVRIVNGHIESVKTHEHRFVNKATVSWFVADEGTRMIDAYSTTRALNSPCGCFHEDLLPDSIARNKGAIFAYSAAVPLAYAGIGYLFHKFGWHRMEWVPNAADTAYDGILGLSNLQLKAPATVTGTTTNNYPLQ